VKVLEAVVMEGGRLVQLVTCVGRNKEEGAVVEAARHVPGSRLVRVVRLSGTGSWSR